MTTSIFEMKIAAKPKVFFVAVAALLEDGEALSLAHIGLDPERLASAVDAWRGSGADEENALDELTKAVARSDLPPEEVRPYADALARRQARAPYGGSLADFSEGSMTDRALRGPAAEVWLACSASKFNVEDAWAALALNEAAQAVAIAHPEILFSQAIAINETPHFQLRFGSKDSQALSPDLLQSFVERLANTGNVEAGEDALQFATDGLQALAKRGAWEQARVLARHAIKALMQDPSLDTAGSATGELVCFAANEQGILLAELAAAACSIRLNTEDVSASWRGDTPHCFIYAPNGNGGLRLPGNGDPDSDRSISLADYALACGEGSPIQKSSHMDADPNSFSHELATLAGELRRQGLAEAIEARGTPQAVRRLVEKQNEIEAKTATWRQSDIAAQWEMLHVMEASEAPRAPSKASMRI